MPPDPSLRSFVVEIDGKAVLAFSAASLDKAKKLCRGEWLSGELKAYTSRGVPVWQDGAALSVRQASAKEAAEVEVARVREIADREYDGIVFAFLVPLDPEQN